MSYAFITTGHIRFNGTGTSSAVDTSGGDFLVAVSRTYLGVITSMSDNKNSGNWTALTTYTDPLSTAVRIFYRLGAVCGSGHTFTVTGGSNVETCVAAFSGSAQTAPFDTGKDTGNNGGAGAVSSQQPGTLTPSVAGALVIDGTGASFAGGTTYSINGGFTITDSAGDGVGLAYLIQTSAAAANPTWTLSGGTGNMVSAQAAFTPATGGGGGTSTLPSRFIKQAVNRASTY